MTGMDYQTAMSRLQSGPPTRVEPIDHRGARIGCVGCWPDGAFTAIAPDGRTRDCATREAAVWWLTELAAGRDPEQPDRRFDIGLLVVVGIAMAVVVWAAVTQ